MSDYITSNNNRALNIFHNRVNVYARMTGFNDDDFVDEDNSANENDSANENEDEDADKDEDTDKDKDTDEDDDKWNSIKDDK